MRLLAGALGALALSVGVAQASHLAIDTEGHTTLEQILTGDHTPDDPTYVTLDLQQVDEDYILRDPAGVAQPGRETRRRSLAYFSQLTDFQLADEESPARVEFLDGSAISSWRPFEAFHPFVIDASIRQVNRFADASPVPQGDGTGNAMDFSLITGDQADNQQRNEMIWTRALLEGGQTLDFGSGLENQADYSIANLPDPVCQAFVGLEGGAAAAAAEGQKYTGVQDYDDYLEGPDPFFYDPDQPAGDWATNGWPTYSGLMDRAQTLTITPAGLDVPSYWINGNHDVLAQGNEDANASFEALATGCLKPFSAALITSPPSNPIAFLDPAVLLGLADSFLVPPDPLRRYVDKAQVRAIVGANNVDNDHGFDFVDTTEVVASRGAADYYAWNPPQTPGVRFIALGTNSEGGILGGGSSSATGSSDGHIDDPQFQWLKDELDAAQAAGKLIVIFGHHPVRTMKSVIPDETASSCTVKDNHPGDNPQHDVNPGCDLDPRPSTPLHFGNPEIAAGFGSSDETFTELLDKYPNVISYVAGHTHEHQLTPFTRTDGSVWWEVNSSATADWPQQHRLVDIMDNRDGTLSIFGTALDAASPSAVPAPCAANPPCNAPAEAGNASEFNAGQLASIGRTLSFADPQDHDPNIDPPVYFSGEGDPEDRNAELLLADPRKADLLVTKADQPDPVLVGQPLRYRVRAINSGPSIATGVTLTDDLPAGVDFESATPESGSCDEAGGEVTCDLGDIPNGATREVEIVVTPEEPGNLLNRAKVEGILEDPDGVDDRATEETTVSGGGGGGKCKGSGAIKGTNGADDLLGTGGRDVMQALRANDRVRGRRGKDKLCGGRGHDRVGGGGGRDFVKGNRGQDIVRGQRGRDRVKGNQGGDLVAGGRGRDVVKGHRGHDILSGGPGFDVCFGGPGRDVARPSCEEVHSASSAQASPP